MKKTTGELLNILSTGKNVNQYLSENQEELINETLSMYLTKLLIEKNLEKSAVIKKSDLDQVYAYQIFSGIKNPSKDKVLCLCFGMGLDLDDVQKLLKIAKASILYPRIKRDSIIIFSLNRNIGLAACNHLLHEMNEETLSKIT